MPTPWINNLTDMPRGGFSQNQFGGTFGGPIKKDKLFFFGDLERFTSRQATTVAKHRPDAADDARQFHGIAVSHWPIRRSPGRPAATSETLSRPGCFDPVAQKLMGLVAGTATPNIPSAVAVEGNPGSWTGRAELCICDVDSR